jgi:proteasome lid subunit RPN8/RPN11
MRWTDVPVQPPSQAWDDSGISSYNAENSLIVRVCTQAVQAARVHLGQSRFEQGGLLLGKLHHAPAQDQTVEKIVIAVSVETVVPAQEGIGTEISLSMPTSVWNNARDLQTPDQVILGWYHSHPNIGAFFSSTDRSTQAAFFNQRWSVAWVIDPIRGEQAWFFGPDSRPVSASALQFT